MVNFRTGARLSRRDVFQLSATAALVVSGDSFAFGASDFWNTKKAAEWTDAEKEEIRTKSPWAKKLDAEVSGGRGGGGGSRGGGGGGAEASSDGGDSGGGGGRGGGGGGGGRRGGGGGTNLAPAANFGGGAKLVVVWESAQPIQDAHPLKLPAKLENHYLIAVTGIPQQNINAAMRGGRGGRGRGEEKEMAPPPSTPPDPEAGLKRGVTLSVKGKEAQNPDFVMVTNNNHTLLFSFPKSALPIAPADKNVEFEIKVGGLTAKTKFNLKEMMYGENLAL